jgi:hypothetical protein
MKMECVGDDEAVLDFLGSHCGGPSPEKEIPQPSADN